MKQDLTKRIFLFSDFHALSSLRENVPRIKKCFARHVFVIIVPVPIQNVLKLPGSLVLSCLPVY